MTDSPPWNRRYPTSLSDPAHPGHSTHTISTNGKTAQRIWGRQPGLPKRLQERLVNRCLGTRIEMCGFITNDFREYYVSNVHQEPTHNYYMHPGEVVDIATMVHNSGRNILGQFHFHPNNVTWPSPRDIAGWPNPDLKWRYWIVTNLDVLEWDLIDHP